MSPDNELLRTLYKTLNERQRPEDIAKLLLTRTDLTGVERSALEKAAKNSIKSTVAYWFSSMPTAFQEPYGMRKQLDKAEVLFQKDFSENSADFVDTAKIEYFLKELNAFIGKDIGKHDYKHDRLNATERAKRGLDMSRRRYNKLFRHVTRLEAKLRIFMREQQKLRFTKISKSSLASEITWDDFSKDMASASFVAYYTARAYKRSVFTVYAQEKAYDEIADVLYSQAIKSNTVNWWIIAQVWPKQEVIYKLTSEQKGLLLGKWTGVLEDIATLLAEVWDGSGVNRGSMIVRRGNDSSTWNQTAGAWNKARDSWFALVYGLGMEDILDMVCFGKVMRLMAADVAAWHRAEGGDVDPDTKVWNELPLPWQVFRREVSCSADIVRGICQKYGVDPEKSGWIAPRPRTHVEEYKPTPELVHGVMVESPFLAKILRDAGFFSGKAGKAKPLSDAEAAVGLHAEVLDEHSGNLKSGAE